jgi:hypothetical protein
LFLTAPWNWPRSRIDSRAIIAAKISAAVQIRFAASLDSLETKPRGINARLYLVIENFTPSPHGE